MEKCRIDRWLWAVRIFKTRSKSADECRSGKVKIDGISVKPSKLVGEGEIVVVRKGPIHYSYKILQTLEKRVGAKLVSDFMEDVTPDSELFKIEEILKLPSVFRRPGEGRPTKRDRRQMDRWKDTDDD